MRLLILGVLACLAGVTAYTLCYYPVSSSNKNIPQPDSTAVASFQAPLTHSQQTLSAPTPPQSKADMPPVQILREPARILLGTTSVQLNHFEQYLPQGAKIATYPVDGGHSRAALVNADLAGDDQSQMVVAYTAQAQRKGDEIPPLTLSILAQGSGGFDISSSTQLIGGILFNINLSDETTPLAVRDITGDGHKEVIVASGGGASIGGQLQIFAVEWKSLREITRIGGHYFNIQFMGTGKPSTITARWKDESIIRRYQWNGQEFVQTGDGSH